jgi:hypothetical protein
MRPYMVQAGYSGEYREASNSANRPAHGGGVDWGRHSPIEAPLPTGGDLRRVDGRPIPILAQPINRVGELERSAVARCRVEGLQ